MRKSLGFGCWKYDGVNVGINENFDIKFFSEVLCLYFLFFRFDVYLF